MGCCGGAVQSVPKKAAPAARPQITGDRVPVAYVGARQGDFWITGQVTRIRYHVGGRGDFLTDDTGKVGVDQRDAQMFVSMNRGRNFKVILPPAPPPPAPIAQAVPEESEAWKPAAMEKKEQRAGVAVASGPNPTGAPRPGSLTLKQLRALEGLTAEGALWMLEEERSGKNRVGAIRFLERIANGP